MEGNRVFKASVFLAAAAIVATAGTGYAAMTKEDASCRATIQKNAGKLGQTAAKTLAGCVKNALKAGSGNCSTIAAADTGGKVAGAAGKVGPGVAKKCLQPANQAVIDAMANCPSPADADDAGAPTSGVDNFTELSNCEITYNTKGLEPMWNYILSPNYAKIFADPNAKAISACANAIAKGASGLGATVSKTRGKAQATSDKALPASYDYTSSTFDDGKINGSAAKLVDGMAKSCAGLTGEEFHLIGACDNTLTAAEACTINAVKKNASGATAVAFQMEGVCPTSVKVVVNGGAAGGQVLTNTVLDTGWTGFGHNADVVDGFTSRVNIDCAPGGDDCSNCNVTASCAEGNCRCLNDPSISCSTPFVASAPCSGNLCIVLFGPPLPLAAGGVATCVVNTIQSPFTGTADVGTGESTTPILNIAKVHLGISQLKPCPTCTGATIGAAGTCSGGQRNSLSCVTNALNTSFGNTSYDCPPQTSLNVTGSGLKVDLLLTDAAVSLPFADTCDFPLGTLACACGACSGDSTRGCKVDADCTGFGTCNNAGGPPRQPNACADLNCVPDPNRPGEGICNSSTPGPPGPADSFCDGAVKTNGDGYIPCTTNGDCTPVGAGNCASATTTLRPCYLNPITADGTPGQDGAELVSAFCSAPTASGSVNAAGGLPGAGRVKLDFDFTGYCPDNTTQFELGGDNCP
jgi:hypothetical protein